jgi:hypothetical protein
MKITFDRQPDPTPEEDRDHPPKLLFRTRVQRRQLLSEFYRRFTQYVREEFDPRHWNMIPEEYRDEWKPLPDLRDIDLSFIQKELSE